QGLTDCHVSSAYLDDAVPLDPEDTVDVGRVELKVYLCCSDRQDCELCLQINITVRGSRHYCWTQVQFIYIVILLSWHYPNCSVSQLKLVLTEKAHFGSPVKVHVYAHTQTTHDITIPSLQEGEMYCNHTPRLRAVTDHEKGIVHVQLDSTKTSQEVLMCQLVWNEMPGKVLQWRRGQREMIFSLNSVAPCMCFQVWWAGKALRRESCPFKNQQEILERMQHNVSVSMEEVQMREGDMALSWTVNAPCRLEAEVWLCKKDSARGHCEEVTGSRQRMHNYAHAGWRTTGNGHWKKGEFVNVSSHPSICVQIKVHGTTSYLEPHCPFATPRWRWSLPLLIGLLLFCLAILAAYFVQGVMKGYMWRWLKEDDIKGAVGGGHVVLLCPPDGDEALPGLLCRLGSSLQALGFSVSLDLWSKAELSMLGPVPWLHSRLDRLQRHGGKVVLVLTQAAWAKAEEWGTKRDMSRERSRNVEGKEEPDKNLSASATSVDVFSASLSCILADYLQGRAGERFVLVQFESLPPEPPGCCRPMPELFRGLHLFSLPSQSLGFLTELAARRQTTTASARRKRAGGLRVASRALARGLSGFTTGSTVLHLAGISQDCVGAGEEDSWETVPLQPCLTTPPSSPDACPKVSGVEWV
uniref:SEFIR domain-containing protein n=1 Tax=Myripristis murdjan TaxID=586833 RepID=A0A667Z5I3_9TELE